MPAVALLNIPGAVFQNLHFEIQPFGLRDWGLTSATVSGCNRNIVESIEFDHIFKLPGFATYLGVRVQLVIKAYFAFVSRGRSKLFFGRLDPGSPEVDGRFAAGRCAANLEKGQSERENSGAYLHGGSLSEYRQKTRTSDLASVKW